MSTAGAGTQLDVMFRAERSPEEWADRHARGEVPGRWPYGLDGLGATGAVVRARSLREPTRVQRVTADLRRLAARRPSGGERRVGLAWDENVARRMVLTAPAPEMVAGVIWLTDALDRGDRPEATSRMLGTLRRMDRLFVTSRAQVEPLSQAVGRTGPPVQFVQFGVDHRFFHAQPYPTRPLVVSIGGDRDRDPRTLFAALERVRAARPEAEVVVQSASDLPPPDGVRKVRHLSHLELRDLYGRASALVVATRPNLHVSGATVGMEAMATGRPVVMTRTPGTEDYFRDGRTALLAPPGDAAGLAEHVLALLADPPAAAALGRAAREEVERRLTTEVMVRDLAAVLELDPPA